MRSRNSAKTASVKRTYSQETTDSVVVSKKSSVASQKSSELTKSREKLTCASLKNFYTQYGLSHLIPLILLIAYTLIGGWIYFWIEHDAEIQEKTSKLKELRDSIGKLRHDLYLNLEAVIMNPNTSRINKLNYTKMAIEWYEEQLQIGVDSSLETYNWDIWNSMFFASTIFTTIGNNNNNN